MSRHQEEVFIRKESRRHLEIKSERFLYYLLVVSFFLILILNFCLPFPIKPTYDFKFGFLGLVLTFFGMLFFLSITFLAKLDFFGWFLRLIVCLILLYFGLPLLLGFSW